MRASLPRNLAMACVLSLPVLTGCQSAMSQPAFHPIDNTAPPPGHGPYTGTVADWPLWFIGHNFSAFSYSTYGCKVVYHGSTIMEEPDDELQISSDSIGAKYPNNLQATRGPIPNFPPPAVVTWRSRDGTAHRAEVDIGAIFKDRLVRHQVAREDIREQASIPPPDIILEVNDRTINVYMRAWIPTKSEQIPGNKYSHSSYDLIKVFSQTY